MKFYILIFSFIVSTFVFSSGIFVPRSWRSPSVCYLVKALLFYFSYLSLSFIWNRFLCVHKVRVKVHFFSPYGYAIDLAPLIIKKKHPLSAALPWHLCWIRSPYICASVSELHGFGWTCSSRWLYMVRSILSHVKPEEVGKWESSFQRECVCE